MPLTSAGLELADAYYIDHPLLYANVLAPAPVSNPVARVDSTPPYYDLLGTSSIAESGNYALVCAEGSTSAQIRVSDDVSGVGEGEIVSVPCSSDAEGLSHVFQSPKIEPVGDPGAYEIAIPKRFVFN